MITIKEGSTRIVFIFKNCVLKIPNFKVQYNHFLLGLLANISEGERSKELINADVAKVKYYNKLGLFLIMERAYPVDKNIDWLRFKETIENKYKNHELGWFMLEDAKPYNWGYINGNLVKIDYA
jgi:hypothetical protein